MREQIQAYVNGLFADAALTIRNAEVRQEILQHTLDRYDDLVASGKPEQKAYDEAVAGIGDVSELYEHKPAEKQAEAPKSARDFPAPPAAPYAAPAAPVKKKKFPGWAIALICAAVVLLEDLSNLVKNGRISKVAGLLGGMLSLRPIMGDDGHGSIAAIEKVRGTQDPKKQE